MFWYIHCNTMACDGVIRDGFGLIIAFVGHFNTQLVITLYKSQSHRIVFPVTVFAALLGNIFQQWTFLSCRAHVLSGWQQSQTNLLLVLTACYIALVVTAQRTPLPTAFLLRAFLLHCLATGMFTEPFPNSSWLFWLSADMPQYTYKVKSLRPINQAPRCEDIRRDIAPPFLMTTIDGDEW
jgi:hypothetical protein